MSLGMSYRISRIISYNLSIFRILVRSFARNRFYRKSLITPFKRRFAVKNSVHAYSFPLVKRYQNFSLISSYNIIGFNSILIYNSRNFYHLLPTSTSSQYPSLLNPRALTRALAREGAASLFYITEPLLFCHRLHLSHEPNLKRTNLLPSHLPSHLPSLLPSHALPTRPTIS